MVQVTYKRRTAASYSAQQPRERARRDALSLPQSKRETAVTIRSIYGNSAQLREAQSQMQADMNAISRRRKPPR